MIPYTLYQQQFGVKDVHTLQAEAISVDKIEDATKEKIKFKLVTWPHDEWQTEVAGSLDAAERLGEIQRNSIEWTGLELNIMCPLAGSTDIGKSWLDTH